jgi:hypothetical protein
MSRAREDAASAACRDSRQTRSGAPARADGIGLVDVVVVNLYPFAAAAANPSTTFDQLVAEIDIGGPSMVRAAAKNFRDVLVVVEPADYGRLLSELDATLSLAFRFELMRKALAHTASYDSGISATLGAIALRGGIRARSSGSAATDAAAVARKAPTATATRITPAWYSAGDVAQTGDLQAFPPSLRSASSPKRGARGAGLLVSVSRRFFRARSCRRRTCSTSMRCPYRARVRRAAAADDQTHEPVRRRWYSMDEAVRARAMPIRCPRSAGSSV